MDKYKDDTRLAFLANFLSVFYSFPNGQVSTDDNEYRIHVELMIYCHIWESKPFLKKLYRLAHILNGEDYSWNVKIPSMSKHDFIRNDIRETFKNNNSSLSIIIKNGFHTSLRNAFAHSEFSFDTINNNRKIILDTYTGQDWDIPEISFDDWSRRFIYSALLSYYMLDLTYKNRLNIVNDFGTDTFIIKHPSKYSGLQDVPIKYRKQYNSFHFE